MIWIRITIIQKVKKETNERFFTHYGEVVHSILKLSPHFQTSPSFLDRVFLSFFMSAKSFFLCSTTFHWSCLAFARIFHWQKTHFLIMKRRRWKVGKREKNIKVYLGFQSCWRWFFNGGIDCLNWRIWIFF